MQPKTSRTRPKSFHVHAKSFRTRPKSFHVHAKSFRIHPKSFRIHPKSLRMIVRSFRVHPKSFRTNVRSFAFIQHVRPGSELLSSPSPVTDVEPGSTIGLGSSGRRRGQLDESG